MDIDDSIGVIGLVPEHWSDVVMARHQVLRRLARRFQVVWVEPPLDWREYARPSGGHFLERDRWFSPHAGLDVLAPGFTHPSLYRPRLINLLSFRSRLAVARRHLEARGARRIVLYLWRDAFAPALRLVRHDLSCYHIVDEYSFSDRERPNSPGEIDLMRRVDQVIVHSPALSRKKGDINPNTAQIPNGVDFRSFASPRRPFADLEAIPRPRIGYAGIIKRQLDLALLARLATARPRYSFVLVGPVMNVRGKEAALEALRRLPNVHLLGAKPPEALPAYVQHFDVCLMCYDVNAYTKFIYPLKLNEYLATGRPIVSSRIDSVLGMEALIDVASGDREWLAALDLALTPTAQDRPVVTRRRAYAQANDWDRLTGRIAELLRDGLEAKLARRSYRDRLRGAVVPMADTVA